jgi:hypothetical protein
MYGLVISKLKIPRNWKKLPHFVSHDKTNGQVKTKYLFGFLHVRKFVYLGKESREWFSVEDVLIGLSRVESPSKTISLHLHRLRQFKRKKVRKKKPVANPILQI